MFITFLPAQTKRSILSMNYITNKLDTLFLLQPRDQLVPIVNLRYVTRKSKQKIKRVLLKKAEPMF